MTLNEKLNLIQIKLKAPKSQRNNFGNYNYRSCEDILEGVKPLLNETKTNIILKDDVVMVGSRIYVKATATLSDGEAEISTTAFARECESKKGMDESQVTGAASSYARKYALNGLLAIDDTKDADTMDNRQGGNASSNSKPTAPKNEPTLKGGESTPEEKAELKQVFDAKYQDGSAIFTRDEMRAYSDMRSSKTAREVIDLIKEEMGTRLVNWSKIKNAKENDKAIF